MTSVFIVTSGGYSDYSIAAVFATQAEAEAWIGLYTKDYTIEEWPLGGERKTPVGMAAYDVFLDRDGNMLYITMSPSNEARAREAYTYIVPKAHGSTELEMCTYMFARDEQHAIKIANERRIQLIATDQWTSDNRTGVTAS